MNVCVCVCVCLRGEEAILLFLLGAFGRNGARKSVDVSRHVLLCASPPACPPPTCMELLCWGSSASLSHSLASCSTWSLFSHTCSAMASLKVS